MRGSVVRTGRQASVPDPAGKEPVVDQTVVVPVVPARTSSVATASIRTVAGCVSRKITIALSRKPSPFGLTVARSARSPANGADPLPT